MQLDAWPDIDIESSENHNSYLEEVALFGRKFILSPKRWRDFDSLEYELIWKSIRFIKSDIATLPDMPGIYCFSISIRSRGIPVSNYIMYIGKTEKQTLNDRVSQYTLKSTLRRRVEIQHLVKYYHPYITINYCECDPELIDINKLEDELINCIIPPFNNRDFCGTLNQARSAF